VVVAVAKLGVCLYDLFDICSIRGTDEEYVCVLGHGFEYFFEGAGLDFEYVCFWEFVVEDFLDAFLGSPVFGIACSFCDVVFELASVPGVFLVDGVGEPDSPLVGGVSEGMEGEDGVCEGAEPG